MKKTRWIVGSVMSAALAVGVASFASAGCGSSREREEYDGPDDAEALGETGVFPDAGDAGTCDLTCRQATCEEGKKTTVSGTVFDPGGHLPLYNVIVFVPTERLSPIVHGATCERCGTVASGAPLVSALTDAKGHFVLENVPTGKDVPLVIQIGKWRREITLPNVEACRDNPIVDDDLTRLPRNQKEGELPQIAMVTGCDPMECLLRNLGIDEAEFTNPDGPGRVHVYQATQGSKLDDKTPAAQTFWGDPEKLKKYDMVVLACECAVYPETKPPEARAAMRDYVNAGGRLFSAHYHYFWLEDGGADLASTAEWATTPERFGGRSYLVDQSFPKGAALADWLVTVGGTQVKGELPLGPTPKDVNGVNPKTTQRWIYDPDSTGVTTKYLSFNTPVTAPAENQCGRVVFTDLHVSGARSTDIFPASCTTQELSVQEKVLEFLMYDLTACVQKDSERPGAPH